MSAVEYTGQYNWRRAVGRLEDRLCNEGYPDNKEIDASSPLTAKGPLDDLIPTANKLPVVLPAITNHP